MKIAVVVVPFITTEYHFNIGARTVLSLLGNKTEHELDLISIVNACRTGDAHLQWFKNTFNYCEINDRNILARAWNKGIRLGLERGNRYVLVINLDLVFHSRFLDNLVGFATKRSDAVLWSGTPWEREETLEQAHLEGETPNYPHYNCFMVDDRLFKLVGEFDEQFEPAYHEDMDMAYRMRLAGVPHIGTNSARFYHLDRATLKGAMIEKDEQLLLQIRQQMNSSMERYKQKWGGLPGEETFKVPYNKL